MHTILDDKQEKTNKPRNQIRRIDASVCQATAQNLTGGFEGLIHRLLAVSFRVHQTWGAFP